MTDERGIKNITLTFGGTKTVYVTPYADDAVQRDAERYRFLRARIGINGAWSSDPDEIDNLIDEWMKR